MNPLLLEKKKQPNKQNKQAAYAQVQRLSGRGQGHVAERWTELQRSELK